MSESLTTAPPLAGKISEFNVGFAQAVGPELSAVFASEQRDLVASGVPIGAVDVGDRIGDAGLSTATGGVTSLAAELDGTPAVLVFYRGAWCPYCNLTLKHYQLDLLPALTERGFRLLAVSPQTPDGTAAAIENGALGFGVFSDPDGVLIRELGIITEPSAEARTAHTALGFDVADSNHDGTASIPFPSVIIIDADRVVRFVDIHVDYTSRTEAADIIAAVDVLLRDAA